MDALTERRGLSPREGERERRRFADEAEREGVFMAVPRSRLLALPLSLPRTAGVVEVVRSALFHLAVGVLSPNVSGTTAGGLAVVAVFYIYTERERESVNMIIMCVTHIIVTYLLRRREFVGHTNDRTTSRSCWHYSSVRGRGSEWTHCDGRTAIRSGRSSVSLDGRRSARLRERDGVVRLLSLSIRRRDTSVSVRLSVLLSLEQTARHKQSLQCLNRFL